MRMMKLRLTLIMEGMGSKPKLLKKDKKFSK
jgi:hypothetical protein